MAMFKAFKPEAMNKIAKAMGYSGDMGQFQSYIEQDPMRQQQMQRYTNAAIQMARGGVVRMQAGGSVADLEKQLAELQAKQKEYQQNFSNVVGSRSKYDEKDYNYAVSEFRRKYGNNYRDRIRASQQQLEAARKAAATPPPAAKPPENPYTGLPQIPQVPAGQPAPGGMLPVGSGMKAAQQPISKKISTDLPPEFKSRKEMKLPKSDTDPRLGGTPVDNRTRMPDGRMPPLPSYAQPQNQMQTGDVMEAPGSVQQTALARGNTDEGFVNPNRQFAPGTLAQAQNQMQMSGNITGNLEDAYDPRGIQPVTKPAANTGTVAPAMGQPVGNLGVLGGPGTGGFSGLLFVPDPSRPKSEDQLQTEWKRLQESARKSRAEGFLGQVVLPGEGRYEDWKQMNQYELMRNPDAPDSLYDNFDMTGMGTQQPAAQPTGPSTGLPQQPVPVTGGPAGAAQDPYAQYRTNVETFPGTNQLKNPAIQTQFDEMTKALGEDDDASDPYKKTRAILDYVQTLYTGPITLGQTGATGPEANQLTPEFQKFARDVGINIKEGPAADGPKVLELVENSPIATTAGYLPPPPQGQNIQDFTVQQFAQPALPEGGAVAAVGIQAEADQMIDPTTGQVTGVSAVPTAMAKTYQAQAPAQTDANLMQANTAAGAVNTALQATQAAQVNPNDPLAQVTAAQQTATSVGSLSAAQGNAILMENPTQRQIQAGELISGVANAQRAAQFTEKVQAAQATPSDKATVQGQLEGLMTQFEGGQTPVWAAGAMRAATAKMAQRGLGASSLAGQAIVQAAMESALPIAQVDAGVFAQFEQQNLSNRQQRAMLAAQQRAAFMGQEFDQAFQARVANSARIGDIANMNFTADQQVALENSRVANTVNLNNLSNNQALVMAEAAALSQMDAANLNNRQQAAVMNAQNFMQRDMQNLSNKQQTEMFKAQQRVQSLFTDQAAINAARQFNATSQNQTDQFFANLATQTSQFNATQANAQAQFNAGERNVLERFNAELNNQRDQFNATNQLAIAQSNAVWRREIATANTAAINRANELNATSVLDISKTAYDNLWNYYGDTMEWAWTSAENSLDRIVDMAVAELDAKTRKEIQQQQSSSAAGGAIGSLIGTLGSAYITAKLCWVAREVYGKGDPRWFVFRMWIKYDAPSWLRNAYYTYGESYAKIISKVPPLKWATKKLMNLVVENKRRKVYANL